MSWTKLINNYRSWLLSFGMAQNSDSETQNRFFHYSVFLLLGVPTMLAFGIYHASIGHFNLSLVIFASGISLVLGWRYLLRSGQGGFVYRFNALLFALLLLYMLVIGGDGGSKILWSFTYPLITLFLLGKREGLFWSCGLLFAGSFLLFFDPAALDIYLYSSDFKLRFLISYLIVSSIAYWFEFLRFKYRLGVEEKAALLEQEKQLLEKNIQQRMKAEEEKDQVIEELRQALEEVNTLRGLLPICSYCHKIRDDDGFWSQLEAYFHQRADVTFSHGICPDCKETHFPGAKSSAGK